MRTYKPARTSNTLKIGNEETFYFQQDRFILLTILPIKIVGYFLFQTTNSVTEKLHEYFIFFQKAAANQPGELGRPVATLS